MSLKQVVALVDSDGAYITLANPLKVDVLLGAAALPVNVGASIDRRVSGMIAALDDTVEINTAAVGSLGVQITSTWTGTIVFEATVDDVTWNSITADPGAITSTTANGSWTIACAGQSKVRVRASAWTSGSASVTLNGSTATSTVVLGEPLPSGDNTIGRVKVTDGTDVLQIDGTGAAAIQNPPNLDVAASTLATQATLATRASEATLATRASEATLSTRASETTLAAASAFLSSIDGKLTAPLSVTGPLTDTQLRASPVPVSGPLTDAQVRASPLSVTGSVAPNNVVDTTNSSTTPLAGAGIFIGISREVLNYAAVAVFAYADVAGTLYLEFSTNGTNWDLSIPYTLSAASPTTSVLDVPSGPHAQYFRARYVNGGTPQGAFRLQTLLLANAPAPHSIPLGSIPFVGDDAVLTQSEMIGLSTSGGGTYVPVKVSPSGAIQVGGAVDIGQTNAAQVLNTVPTSGYGLVVRGVYPSQGSTTSGQTGPLSQGAVTTAAPSYSNGQTSPLSLTLAGALRTDSSAVTQPISNTNLDVALSTLALKNQFPTTLGQTTKAGSLSVAWASDTVGTAGAASSTVLTVQGITSMTPLQVSASGSAGTVPVLSTPAMTTTGAQVWAANTSAKVRKIYNPVANDNLYVIYYDGTNNVTNEATSQFTILPGQTWEMPSWNGSVEYTGIVRAALKSGTGNINATQVT